MHTYVGECNFYALSQINKAETAHYIKNRQKYIYSKIRKREGLQYFIKQIKSKLYSYQQSTSSNITKETHNIPKGRDKVSKILINKLL